MGAQPNTAVWLSLSVNATNYEDTLQYQTTVTSAAAASNVIASSVWAYLYNIQGSLATPSTTFKWINGVVRITDDTAPRTPFGAYSQFGASGTGFPAGGNNNFNAAFQENQHFRWNFHLGPNDFVDQPSLAAALAAQFAQAIAFTPNY